VILTAAVWAAGLAAGIALQRRVRRPQRLTHILFLATFWVTSPLMVFFAYTTLAPGAGLLAAMTLVVATSWLVLALGFGAARLAGSGAAERGAMVLGAGLGNTGIVGYPLAAAVFGPPGLALAVVYSEFQFLIPVLAVSTGVARRFAGPGACAPGAPDLRTLLRSWVVNPPVAAGVLAVALRLAGADLRDAVEPLGSAAALAIGLFGFVQVGLAAPLELVAHTLVDLGRAGLTLAVRCGAGPLALLGLGRITGVEIPGAFLLLAATPVAFHTIVLARVYALDGALLRLLVAISTPAVIAAVLLWQAL
jgi:predicted permease